MIILIIILQSLDKYIPYSLEKIDSVIYSDLSYYKRDLYDPESYFKYGNLYRENIDLPEELQVNLGARVDFKKDQQDPNDIVSKDNNQTQIIPVNNIFNNNHGNNTTNANNTNNNNNNINNNIININSTSENNNNAINTKNIQTNVEMTDRILLSKKKQQYENLKNKNKNKRNNKNNIRRNNNKKLIRETEDILPNQVGSGNGSKDISRNISRNISRDISRNNSVNSSINNSLNNSTINKRNDHEETNSQYNSDSELKKEKSRNSNKNTFFVSETNLVNYPKNSNSKDILDYLNKTTDKEDKMHLSKSNKNIKSQNSIEQNPIVVKSPSSKSLFGKPQKQNFLSSVDLESGFRNSKIIVESSSLFNKRKSKDDSDSQYMSSKIKKIVIESKNKNLSSEKNLMNLARSTSQSNKKDIKRLSKIPIEEKDERQSNIDNSSYIYSDSLQISSICNTEENKEDGNLDNSIHLKPKQKKSIIEIVEHEEHLVSQISNNDNNDNYFKSIVSTNNKDNKIINTRQTFSSSLTDIPSRKNKDRKTSNFYKDDYDNIKPFDSNKKLPEIHNDNYDDYENDNKNNNENDKDIIVSDYQEETINSQIFNKENEDNSNKSYTTNIKNNKNNKKIPSRLVSAGPLDDILPKSNKRDRKSNKFYDDDYDNIMPFDSNKKLPDINNKNTSFDSEIVNSSYNTYNSNDRFKSEINQEKPTINNNTPTIYTKSSFIDKEKPKKAKKLKFKTETEGSEIKKKFFDSVKDEEGFNLDYYGKAKNDIIQGQPFHDHDRNINIIDSDGNEQIVDPALQKNATADLYHHNNKEEVEEEFEDIWNNKATLLDFEELHPKDTYIYDRRNFCAYFKDVLLNEHIILSLFYKNSLFLPIYIRIQKMITYIFFLIMIATILYSDEDISAKNKLDLTSTVIYYINLIY